MGFPWLIDHSKIELQKQQQPTGQSTRYLRFVYQVLQSYVVNIKDKLIAQKVVTEFVYRVHHGEGFLLGCRIVLLGSAEESGGICNRLVDLAGWILG